MIASLPMYDRPELRKETDALWSAMRDAIRARGMDAPETLDRETETANVWTDPAMVLSQTCGMPWRLGLYTKTQLIGTPDYGVAGCPPGYYCSIIIVRADEPGETRADFANGTCAFNARDSQSGFAAWEGAEFSTWLHSGAHGESIKAVANGNADIAAIDAVTWRLAERYDPEVAALRVLETTKATPGLPFITSKHQNAGALSEAVSEAINGLDSSTRDALSLTGLVPIPSADYLAA